MSRNTRTYLLQGFLFLLTLVTTTLAGAEWIYGSFFIPGIGIPDDKLLRWPQFWEGLQFSLPFLLILTVHEFGHFFTAKAHRVGVSLPYYIPLWFGITQTIGTMGAFICITTVIKSRLKFFDIGIAGPLAGFVVAFGVLWYGFTHLPPPEYIFKIHPEYAQYGLNYGDFVYKGQENGLMLGDTILFWWFKNYVADPSLLPHAFEITHYPFILAGYISLFFTALNLIPIGQLDGGHILYGLLGKRRFNMVAPVLFVLFAFYAGLGMFKPEEFAMANDDNFFTLLGYLALYVYFLYICLSRISDNRRTGLTIALGIVVTQFAVSFVRPDWEGYSGFLPFVFLLGRFLGIYHPETEDDDTPLSTGRIILGWVAVIVFILCASPKPFIIMEG